MNIDEFKEILRATQPFATTDHQKIQVELREGWSKDLKKSEADTVVNAFVVTPQQRFQLTAGALMSLASTLQMGKDMLLSSPANLIEPLLNWWFGQLEDEDSPAFTLGANNVITAVVKPSGELPEFPAFYVDTIVDTMRRVTGGEQFSVHPWYMSNMKETFCIVYSDGMSHTIGEDVWYTGIVFRMSASGALVPTLNLAFVRLSDLAVYITSLKDIRYRPSKDGQGVTNTQTWVEESVDTLCGLADSEARMLGWLVKYDASEHVGHILSDIMHEVSLPPVAQSYVLDSTVDNDDTSGYGLLNDILSALDFSEDSPYDNKINERIMRGAGRLWTVLNGRCDSCHQLY